MNDAYLESLESPLSVDATQMMHISRNERLKAIWRKETKKTFGGRYLNFEEKFTHF